MHPSDKRASSFELIQEEVDAFNNGDLDRFLATFAADVTVDGLATADGPIVGLEEMRIAYSQRIKQPGIHASIFSRAALDPWIVDHEIVTTESGSVTQLAIYEIVSGKIAHVSIVRPHG